ncbi:hypothetical protein Plhal304r1_c007g0029161 [Plasmopara halstedii]
MMLGEVKNMTDYPNRCLIRCCVQFERYVSNKSKVQTMGILYILTSLLGCIQKEDNS